MGGETDDEEYKELLLPNETPESEEGKLKLYVYNSMILCIIL